MRTYMLSGAVVGLVIAGAGGFAWSLAQNRAPHFLTAVVTRGSVVRSVTATGVVRPVETAVAAAAVSGIIDRIYCDYNIQVRAGEVCAQIDPRPYRAKLDQYSARLRRDQTILEKARADFERKAQLAAQNAALRLLAKEQSSLLNRDEATVRLDRALVEGARLNLRYTEIVSPLGGMVISRNVRIGQTVKAGSPALFVFASDLKHMEVDARVSERDVGKIKVGDKATVKVDAYPGRIFPGVVVQIRQSLRDARKSVTYDVIISLENRELALRPGMSVTARIVVEQKPNVLRLPDQALRFYLDGSTGAPARSVAAGEKRTVWALRDGKPVAVRIVTGVDDGTFSEIVDGDLHAGDRVVTAPRSLPVIGQPWSAAAAF